MLHLTDLGGQYAESLMQLVLGSLFGVCEISVIGNKGKELYWKRIRIDLSAGLDSLDCHKFMKIAENTKDPSKIDRR